MIWTTNAKKLLEELDRENLPLTLDSLTIKAGEANLQGRGEVKRENGSFSLAARFDLGAIPADFEQAHFEAMQNPRLIGRDQFWLMTARTSSGVSFTCEAVPAHGWKNRSDGVTEIRCHASKIVLQPQLLDATDFRCFEPLLKKLNEPGALEKGEIKFSLDPPEPLPAKFHAILPGVKCVLAEHITQIERHNAYLGTTSSKNLDTFLEETDERKIALIEEDGNLHVYLELPPGNRTEDAEKSAFSALLDAVAFTHGCHPHPSLQEYSRNGRVVCCEIRAITNLKISTIKPLHESSVFMSSGSKLMLGVAHNFFQGDKAIVTRIRKAMWTYREAATEGVPLPIQVLTACTLLEGVVQYLFDAHGLKASIKNGEPAAIFKGNKEAAKELLMQRHCEIRTEGEAETDWSRMAGYLNSCNYVRPKERLKAVAEFFDFPWENDVEQIHEIWNRHRNALAHGTEIKDDFDSISGLIQGWSRLSGAIHRLILAEMGYIGSFSYSPMEPGLQEMDLKSKAAVSQSTVGPEVPLS